MKKTISEVDAESTLIPHTILEKAKDSISTTILLLQHEDGSMSRVPGKKRGNSVYNFHMGAKMKLINIQAQDKLKVDFNTNSTNTFFITLTTQYVPGSIKSTLEAIDKVQRRMPSFIKALKRKFGEISYIHCKECHKKGGCHVHFLLQLNNKMYPCFKDHNGDYRSDLIRDIIKELWAIGNVDVKGVMNDNGVFAYVTKELGKSQNVEGAIKRYEDGEKLVKNDTNKIWLLGASLLYKEKTGKTIRFLCCSRDYKVTEDEVREEKQREIEQYRLDKYMNNTDNKKDNDDLMEPLNAIAENKIVKYVCINKRMARKLPHFYKAGVITSKNDKRIYEDILNRYGTTVLDGCSMHFDSVSKNIKSEKDFSKLKEIAEKIIDIKDITRPDNVVLCSNYLPEYNKELETIKDNGDYENPVVRAIREKIQRIEIKFINQMKIIQYENSRV